jgi:DNA-binding YbaB/EbfC family protein
MAKSSGRNRYLRRAGTGGASLPGLGAGAGGSAGANPLAQAQEMLARAQQELAEAIVEGTAGGGAVKIQMTAQRNITGIQISPDVLDPDDVTMLQDLILAAIADATEKAEAKQAESLGALTGGLNLPGLGLG